MKFRLFFSFLVFAFFASAHTVDSLRSEKRGDQWFVIHEVEPGETLFGITRRYKADINRVIQQNKIENNYIQVGQVLEIPVTINSSSTPSTPTHTPKVTGTLHTVAPGETLFAISRKYSVSVDDIKNWNDMRSESLAVGQVLKINGNVSGSSTKPDTTPTRTEKPKDPAETIPFARAQKHHVQIGETLDKIAQRRGVSQDSLKKWNGLSTDDLKIGQLLWYRTYTTSGSSTVKREAFGKRVEEGVAMQIEETDMTDKYLALHKTLPVGTLMEVRNLMNNKKVYVRVVGNLPATGANENVIVRLTAKSFQRLGILDARARVELTYYED